MQSVRIYTSTLHEEFNLKFPEEGWKEQQTAKIMFWKIGNISNWSWLLDSLHKNLEKPHRRENSTHRLGNKKIAKVIGGNKMDF